VRELTPVGVEEFAARLEPLRTGVPAGPVAVAVSGGPDSLALLHLAHHWARRRGCAVSVYTVDHGLRPEAAAEASGVAALAARYGRPHRTLVWRGAKPTRGVQAAARDARYALLGQACRDDGIGDLLVAHHRDDQAETLLHRIARDTGPDGLAGMAPTRDLDGVRLLRPLLDLPKARLLATCEAAGLMWVDDPSNADARFARGELRTLAPALADLGITAERLGRLAEAMGRVRLALDGFAAQWMAVHGIIGAGGDADLDRAALVATPPVLRRRLIERVLRAVGGASYPPRGERLAALIGWTEDDADGVRTLSGCRVEKRAGRLRVVRDWRQAERPIVVAAGDRARWDGRFEIVNTTAAPVRVGACGEEGWRRWRRAFAAGGGSMPHGVRLALPAVADLDGRIVLPHLHPADAASGWHGGAVRARFRPRVPLFALDADAIIAVCRP